MVGVRDRERQGRAFYDRNGWRRVRATINLSETDEGTFPLEVWRYEKRLIGGPASS
jgi:hypothetical protein